MGLDWKPINKPKEGFESEFEDLFYLIGGKRKQSISLFDKLKGVKLKSQEELLKRFFEISIPVYVTLNAPIVGKDEDANKWAASKFELRVDKNLSFEQFMDSMNGYYVVDLVPEHDGIPKYVAFQYERHVFRGQFLNDCEDIIGKSLLEEAYTSKLAKDTIEFGKRLMIIAEDYSNKSNCYYLKDQRMPPETDEDKPESKTHIIFSAAKWLLWWGERGHGYEADF